MIRLNNVEKTIKSPAGTIWLLRRINIEIKEGEFVTIMGPSGAGKTTLLSIVGLLDDGWAGEYFLLDQPVHKIDRKHIAVNFGKMKINPGDPPPLKQELLDRVTSAARLANAVGLDLVPQRIPTRSLLKREGP